MLTIMRDVFRDSVTANAAAFRREFLFSQTIYETEKTIDLAQNAANCVRSPSLRRRILHRFARAQAEIGSRSRSVQTRSLRDRLQRATYGHGADAGPFALAVLAVDVEPTLLEAFGAWSKAVVPVDGRAVASSFRT
jgi:hypothetical protein